MTNLSLHNCLRRVRLRLLTIGSAAGIIWATGAAFGLLLVGVWLDLLWELSSEWRLALLWTAGFAGIILAIILARKIFENSQNRPVARRLDRLSASGGVILTGVELEEILCTTLVTQNPEITAGLAHRAVCHAAEVAKLVPPADAVPLKTLRRPLAGFTLMMGLTGIVSVCMPGLAKTQWNRFVHPFNDVPPYSQTHFDVTPGNVEVVYGKELEIRAKVIGAPVEQAELMIDSGRGLEPPLPMFPELDGSWRTVLAKVTEPAEYHVRANRTRSEKYQIRVITLPRIEKVHLRITSPPYANRPPYEGPMPKEGVAGLAGTKVQVSIHSNRPLKGGKIEIGNRGKKAAITMNQLDSGSQTAVGEFEITADGKFECRVIDTDDQTSEESFSGSLTLLPDEQPFIRITQPPKISLATSNAVLPVMISAEDDCGISRLELFRNLNDSRFLPNDVSPSSRPPRRMDAPVLLSLAKYGLQPGDVIKIFGRVEDNDPRGAKGAESSVATVRIISQDEFDKMIQEQKGIEALMSKYQSAQRQMDKMANELEKLRDEIKKLPPNEQISKETREELKRLQKMMQEQADAINRLSKQKMPFDADNILAPQLDQIMQLTKDMAKELEKLNDIKDIQNDKLSDKLSKLMDVLTPRRKSYNEQVSMPLEKLEYVFRLMVDEQRFIALAQWQRDLAERLASLKGRDGEDNPALKSRCREMEQEQRQIREGLSTLLSDIEDHINRLPNDSELYELRLTATEFLKDLRASGAAAAMSDAESALAEFAVTRGHEKANNAADILEKFIKKCEGNCNMQGNCQGHIFFQPQTGGGLGNTLGQLLNMGMGSGYGMGGYSAVGIYGGLPVMSGVEGWLGNDQDAVWNHNPRIKGTVPNANPDASTPRDNANPGNATGASESSTPLQYRREVGKYFQRVSEETGEVNP